MHCVAILAESFLPKLDGSTVILAHLLQHLHFTGIHAMFLGPETGMASYASAALFEVRTWPSGGVRFEAARPSRVGW
ncbi:hypothetical protein K438DRAFT_1976632 [Mycena galopus ATCC 62051]|nr:hypothetical protein K438DRAFT_1976632 [Mycena galopus ATCC 62051]